MVMCGLGKNVTLNCDILYHDISGYIRIQVCSNKNGSSNYHL